MAKTNAPWTREDWNDIIQRVNDKINEDHSEEVHKRDGDRPCDSPDEIEEVEENHIWSKSDISEVFDALEDMCPDVEFDDMEEDQIWKSWIIDDIEEAIPQAWCDCEKEDECECDDTGEAIKVKTIDTPADDRGTDNVWCPSQGAPGCTDIPPSEAWDDWADYNAGVCIVGEEAKAYWQMYRVRPRCGSSFIGGDCGELKPQEDWYYDYKDGGANNCNDGCIPHRDDRREEGELPPEDPEEDRKQYNPMPCVTCHACTIRIESCFLFWCMNIPCVIGACVCGECPQSQYDAHDCGVQYCQCRSSNPWYYEIRFNCDKFAEDGKVPCEKCCPEYVHYKSFARPCGLCPDDCGYDDAFFKTCCCIACECDEDNEECTLPEDNPDTPENEKEEFCAEATSEENCIDPI